MLHGPRLWVVCGAAILLPPALLMAYHLAPKDVTPEEAQGILYVYSADS